MVRFHSFQKMTLPICKKFVGRKQSPFDFMNYTSPRFNASPSFGRRRTIFLALLPTLVKAPLALVLCFALIGCEKKAPVKGPENAEIRTPPPTVPTQEPVNKLTISHSVTIEVEVKQGEEVDPRYYILNSDLPDLKASELSLSEGKDGLNAKIAPNDKGIGFVVSATKDAKPGVQDITVKFRDAVAILRTTVKENPAK